MIRPLLQQVAAFMTNSTTEVVIVETATTNDAVTGGDTGTLVAMIEEELGNWMYPRAGGFNDTISSMVAMDKRLVVSIDNETAIAEHPAFWLGSDTILNSYANQCNLTLVEQFNDDRVAEYQSYRTNPSLNGKLYKISWTRTPNFDCILCVAAAAATQTRGHSRVRSAVPAFLGVQIPSSKSRMSQTRTSSGGQTKNMRQNYRLRTS